VEQHYFGRERQVLDRGPAGDHTDLRDVVVRVAAEINRLHTRIVQSVGKAILGSARRLSNCPRRSVALTRLLLDARWEVG
jgi:hypothetical protein